MGSMTSKSSIHKYILLYNYFIQIISIAQAKKTALLKNLVIFQKAQSNFAQSNSSNYLILVTLSTFKATESLTGVWIIYFISLLFIKQNISDISYKHQKNIQNINPFSNISIINYILKELQKLYSFNWLNVIVECFGFHFINEKERQCLDSITNTNWVNKTNISDFKIRFLCMYILIQKFHFIDTLI